MLLIIRGLENAGPQTLTFFGGSADRLFIIPCKSNSYKRLLRRPLECSKAVAKLFLPEFGEEAVVEEVPPGGPVVAGFTYTEVFIFDSVLVKGVCESLDACVERAFLFCSALAYEQVIHFVIGCRVVEESRKGLFRSVVSCAEDAEVCKEVKILQTYEYCVAATH